MASVTVSYVDHVAQITIDNPPVNALTQALVEDIGNAFEEVLHTQSRAVVITGAGNKAFVAGADISQFTSMDDIRGKALVTHGQKVFQKVAEFPLPVICAIDGFALGGGCELALACDIRIASKKSKLGLPETGLGIIPGYGGTQRLPRVVGASMAKKMIFSGEAISAEEAYRIGLCDTLAEDGQALTEALALAKKIAGSAAPLAVKTAKRLINTGLELSLEKAIELEAELFGPLCLTKDKTEGVEAFLGKRRPEFAGE